MPFSTIDQDNDRVPNKTCREIFGPGWHWDSIYKEPHDCYNAEVNLFGPYSPNAVGNASNLFHAGINRPITYLEMKRRYSKGYKRAVFTTTYAKESQTKQGFSMFHAPHEVTLHLASSNKAWTLSISPHHDWAHYAFTWSRTHGLRGYENGLLTSQTRVYRNVTSSERNYWLLAVGESHTTDTMYVFMSRLKTWNKELTLKEIYSDYNQEDFTLEGDSTHWYAELPKTFNWTLSSNSTFSNGTGPLFDHTYSGFPQGSYYYLESSYPRSEGEVGLLSSQVFFPNHHKCFHFWYHMRGKGMGKMVLNMVSYTRPPYQTKVEKLTEPVWTRQGESGIHWKYAILKINAPGLFKLILNGFVGADYRSDMAVDDLSISNSCPDTSTCDPKCKEGFTCLQEQALCDCKGMKHVDPSCEYVLSQSVFKGVAHHWPLDDPTNITTTHGSLRGFTSGNVTAVRGVVNNALATDGLTGQITLADMRSSCIMASPSCSSGFTLGFWLKFGRNDNKQKRVYLSLGQDKTMSRGFQFLQDFSLIKSLMHLIVRATIDKVSCLIGFEVHPSIWSTIAFSWGPDNGFTLYHNGKNVTDFLIHECMSMVSVFPNNAMLRTGFGSDLPDLHLDDVTLWYKELSAEDIVNIFRYFTAPEKSISLSIKFPNEIFNDRLSDQESAEFKAFDAKVLHNARSVFQGKSKDFQGTNIVHLSNGCVNAHLSLLFGQVTNTELDLLFVALCKRQLFGQMKTRPAANTTVVIKNISGATTRQVNLCESHDAVKSRGWCRHDGPGKRASCNITMIST